MLDDNPYRIPDDGRDYLVHVSGGRTSGLMFRRILEAHDGRLPTNARAIFTNTGKEREETLLFVYEMARRWGVEITWLEYTYRTWMPGGRGPAKQKNWFRRTHFLTACRHGQPFEEMIRSRMMLPNVVMRMCTTELKVNTAARYARWVLGWRKPISVLGMRADEPHRLQKAIFEECRTMYPLALAGVDEAEVLAYWAAAPFDLGLRPSQGNCDLCFLKGQGKLVKLIAEEPERADWWIAQEKYREKVDGIGKWPGTRDPTIRQFLKRASFTELRNRALSRLPFDAPRDDRQYSCFCGD